MRRSVGRPAAQKVIVVTEGDTDREVLERSLRLLYPHLADYFHFFDFSLSPNPPKDVLGDSP